MRPLRLLAAAAFVAVVFACSSSSTPATPDYAGTCRTLGSRCHGVKDPLADECHNLGHDGDDSKCGPRFDECIAVCPEKEAGAHPHDSGVATSDADAAADAGDAETAAPPDRCTLFCQCMVDTCSMKTGYPWGSGQDACLTGCRGLSTEALDCQIPWCDHAKADGAGSASDHSCGHAWGHECH